MTREHAPARTARPRQPNATPHPAPATAPPARPEPEPPARAATPARWAGNAAGWIRTHPGMAVALVVPLVLFCAPLPFGHIYLDGDNLIQNYPLRVLVGRDLAHGTAPLLNPYLFSGTPLLGGFNAGAAYPTTWLYAVLPQPWVWSVNLALAYDTALVGTYLFLRRQPVGTTAATLGAVTFAFFGYLSGQIVHVDIVTGASWVPWILLGVHQLTQPPWAAAAVPPDVARRRRRGWTALVAVAGGLCVLSGGAESAIDGAVLVGIYLVGRVVAGGLLRSGARRRSAASLVALVVGVVGAGALAAAQLLPGSAFLAQSHRGTPSYTFFVSGNLPVRDLALLVSPFALGTNQSSPAWYVGEYNFPEVTSYVGILALIAGCTLWARRWRRRPEARQWWIWYVVLAVGAVCALGGQTPVGHLLFDLPVINSQRLLNRNLLLVDFALAVLVGWWVHLLLDGRTVAPAAAPRTADPPARGRRVEVVLTCLPVTLMAVVAVLLWAAPGPFLRALGGNQLPPTSARWLALIVTGTLAVGAFGTGVALAERRLGRRALRRLLTVVLVLDLGFFTWWVLHPPVTLSLARTQGALADRLVAVTGDGRFTVYDPDQFEDDSLLAMGQTDLNLHRSLPSAQGYAALVDNDYYAATGAHLQETLDPATLATPVWDQLNTSVVLSVPGYFVTPAPGSTPPPGSTDLPRPVTSGFGAPVTTPVALSGGATRQWFLGGVLDLRSVTVPVTRGMPEGLRVGLVTPAGGIRWLPVETTPFFGTSMMFALPAPTAAAGVVVEAGAGSPVTVAPPTVDSVRWGSVVLDGPMQAVTAPHWVYDGTVGPFGVFRNTRAQGWAWATGPTGAGPAPAGTSVTAAAPGPGGGQTVTVRAAGPVTLVRSVAWTTGWQATAQAVDPTTGEATGPSRSVAVAQDGLVQQVRLPAGGTWRVTFAYRPTSALAGVAVSALAGVAVVGWAVAEGVGAVRRRRRRRGAAVG